MPLFCRWQSSMNWTATATGVAEIELDLEDRIAQVGLRGFFAELLSPALRLDDGTAYFERIELFAFVDERLRFFESRPVLV